MTVFGAVRSEPVTDEERRIQARYDEPAEVAELRDVEAAELHDLDRPPPWCPACGVHLLDLERGRGEAARCPVCRDDAAAPARAARLLRRSGFHVVRRAPGELLSVPVTVRRPSPPPGDVGPGPRAPKPLDP